MKKINTLEISAKKWYQKSYGNTYHTVKVIVNNDTVLESGITYGYGKHYLATAANLLRDNGYNVPESNQEAYSMMLKYPYDEVEVSRKRDL